MSRSIHVTVLAFGPEPDLRECVRSVLASVDGEGAPLELELTVVDNGARTAVTALDPDRRLRILRPDGNRGFAGGCNLGAGDTEADILVFLNSDAAVAPAAIFRLTQALVDEVVLVSGSVRLADAPSTLNTAGNPVHYLGLSWAGAFGEPAINRDTSTDTTSITGSFFAVQRSHWRRLGGFGDQYFAYHEDAEFSLRTWLVGQRVRYVHDAVAVHHYDFSRNSAKYYLLERNRLLTVLTVFPTPVLGLVSPMLIAFEMALLIVAARSGWGRQKLKGYAWLLKHARQIAMRRRAVQVDRAISANRFAHLLAARIEPQMMGELPGLAVANSVLAGYWHVCLAVLTATDRKSYRSAAARPGE